MIYYVVQILIVWLVRKIRLSRDLNWKNETENRYLIWTGRIALATTMGDGDETGGETEMEMGNSNGEKVLWRIV